MEPAIQAGRGRPGRAPHLRSARRTAAVRALPARGADPPEPPAPPRPAATIGAPRGGGSTAPIPFFGQTGYIALTAFVINLIIAVVLTLIFRAARLPAGADETLANHYIADAGEPIVHELPVQLVERRMAAGPEGGASGRH